MVFSSNKNHIGLLFFCVLMLFNIPGLPAQMLEDSLTDQLAQVQGQDRLPILRELIRAQYKNDPQQAVAYGKEANTLLSSKSDADLRSTIWFFTAYSYRILDEIDSLKAYTGRLKSWANDKKYIEGQAYANWLEGMVFSAEGELEKASIAFVKAGKLIERGENTWAKAKLSGWQADTYRNLDENEKAAASYARAISFYRELGDQKSMLTSLLFQGNIYRNLGKFPEALDAFSQLLKIQQAAGDSAGIAVALSSMAVTYDDAGELDSALALYQRATPIMERHADSLSIARTYSLTGVTYSGMGKFSEALAYYLKALNWFEALGNLRQVSNTRLNIGNVYARQEKYEQALPYFEGFLEVMTRMENKRGIIYGLQSAGNVYQLLFEYEKAIAYYQQAQPLMEEIGDLQGKAQISQSLGEMYMQLGKLDEARSNYFQSLSIHKSIGDRAGTILTMSALGTLFLQKDSLDQALAYLDSALALSVPGESFIQERSIQEDRATVLEKMGRFEEALQAYRAFKAANDSMFTSESQSVLAELQQQYETKEQKQRIDILELDRQVQRLWMIGIALAALLLALVAIMVFNRFRLKKRAQLTEAEEQTKALRALDELKSSLFTNVSHEFRTPLTIIRGMAEQVVENPERWLVKGMAMIRRNTDNLLAMVNQILDLRKIEAGKMSLQLQALDIVGFARYVLESFSSLAEGKDIELSFESSPQELWVESDESKMLQILSNLISNAIKYSPAGGEVRLQLAVESRQWAVGSMQSKNHTLPTANSNLPTSLLLTVSDKGPGISEADTPFIFDRFFRVKETHAAQGSGIGLALTRELVQLMGGEIAVKSVEGEGSSFTCKIPYLKAEAIVQKNMTFLPVSSSASPNPQIALLQEEDLPALLIVEDNADVQQYLIACLEDSYKLSLAKDGEEGIQKAIEEVPDLILSDVMMPRKDGFELCNTLKLDERTSHIPIVLLTARADDESRIAGYERGADAYLAKPFNQTELLVRLRKLLELRQMLQQRYQGLQEPEPAQDPITRQEDAFMQKLQAEVHANLSDDSYTVPQLCEAIGMSRTQLHNKIKALTGFSTTIFIRTVRLQKAKELILHSQLTISEIAYEVGFVDPSYFSRKFAEEFGDRPSSMRK